MDVRGEDAVVARGVRQVRGRCGEPGTPRYRGELNYSEMKERERNTKTSELDAKAPGQKRQPRSDWCMWQR